MTEDAIAQSGNVIPASPEAAQHSAAAPEQTGAPMKKCVQCNLPFNSYYKICPYCGYSYLKTKHTSVDIACMFMAFGTLACLIAGIAFIGIAATASSGDYYSPSFTSEQRYFAFAAGVVNVIAFCQGALATVLVFRKERFHLCLSGAIAILVAAAITLCGFMYWSIAVFAVFPLSFGFFAIFAIFLSEKTFRENSKAG